MELFQWGTNPWGQEVLIRISWNLLYASAVAGVLFIIAHTIYVALWVPKVGTDEGVSEPPPRPIPERVDRHSLMARVFHWVMAAAMIVLLLTGFLPIVGIQFPWVTIHWIAGVLLTLSIVYHMVHATFWLDFWSIWITPGDLTDAWRRLQRGVGRTAGPPARKHGKYPLENKLYHLIIMLTGFAVIVTGAVMMVRVETPLWTRDPYLFTDQSWGLIYVLHGLAAVALVALTMAHIYFAIRPEKLWITRSMIFGWIDRRHYLEHHDPSRWIVSPAGSAAPPHGSGKSTAVEELRY